MESIFHLDLVHTIRTIGYLGLFCIIFAESGLFFGFFFPGDSLLFTAGLLASQGYFSLWLLLICIALGAILGDSVGYYFGRKVGPALFSREDSIFFHKKHLKRAHDFFETYGSKALVLARFVPVVRTFTPIVAGIGNMSYLKFITYNILGGVLWSVMFISIGYYLGNAVPQTQQYLLPLSLGIVIISLIPIALEFWRNKRNV